MRLIQAFRLGIEARFETEREPSERRTGGPRDIVIITLAEGCGLLGPLLSSGELAQATPRIELVRKMNLIGRTFLNAMNVAVQPAADRLDQS